MAGSCLGGSSGRDSVGFLKALLVGLVCIIPLFPSPPHPFSLFPAAFAFDGHGSGRDLALG